MQEWVDYIFMVAGFALVTGVMVRPPQWQAVDVARGGLVVKLPSALVLAMAGLLTAGIGIFFRYQNYQAKIGALEASAAEAQESATLSRQRIADLEADMRRLLAYDLVVDLQFPEPMVGHQLTLAGLVRKPGDAAPITHTPVRIADGPGGMTVRLNGLRSGDRISFGAMRPDGRQWRSQELEVPGRPMLRMEPQ